MLRKTTTLVLLAGVLWLILAGRTDAGEEKAMKSERVTRAEFERRWLAWRNFIEEHEISCSSFAEPYICNKPFHDLVELGPVAVPWFSEKGGAFADSAIHVILRTDWKEIDDIEPGKISYLDVYLTFDNWWKVFPRSASEKFDKLNRAFRAMLAEATNTTDTVRIRAAKEWQRLRGMGLLGVPSVIQRIKSGVADEYDFRLIAWWTAPVAYSGMGFPRRPDEPAELSSEKKNPAYWLDWWEKNSWQFWWLIPGGKPPE